MHCIRDQINFNRRQNMAHGEGNDPKRPLGSSSFTANKRMKTGPKKLSAYLKLKYDPNEQADKAKELASKSEAERALGHAAPFRADIQSLPASRLPAEAMLAKSQAEKGEAQSAEASRLEEGDDMASILAQKHAFAQAMGGGMQPGLHGLIAKKEAELAALRAAMMGDAGMSAPSMMQYSSLMPGLAPSPLDIKQSMILARAELAAAGLRDPLAERLRLASMMNQDALMADHLRQVALQRGAMGVNPLASLLGGMPATAPLGGGLMPEADAPASATAVKSTE
jgi:hypothetical protein